MLLFRPKLATLTELRCNLLSYAVSFLSYAALCCATMHPTKICFIHMSYVAPYLSYDAPYLSYDAP
jgi:hypothetical protein